MYLHTELLSRAHKPMHAHPHFRTHTELLYLGLKHGLPVLLTDIDVIYLHSPFPYFKQAGTGQTETQISPTPSITPSGLVFF